MLIEATTQTTYGNVYILTGDDDLHVGAGVTLTSTYTDPTTHTGADAVISWVGTHTITVDGTIIGADEAINLAGCVTAQTIIINAGGQLIGGGDGVVEDADGVIMDGAGSTLTNAGSITAYGSAISAMVLDNSTMTITNSGTMYGRVSGVWHKFGNGTMNFTNSGTVTSPAFSFLGGNSVDNVTNSGSMIGTISLGNGNDTYSGRFGTVTGQILGGGGNDTFVSGVGAEYFDGGEGLDTVSYASASVRLVVDLVNGALTRGSLALGDTLVSIEGVITGNKADILRGNDADNMLNGAAGTDVLTGAAGADTLIGGGGADSLTGGSGADAFLFYGTADFKDVITDFTQGEDVIQIEGTAIGLGSYAGTLDASRFHSGTSNAAADIYDRLIFNTSTTTLWYDRDGSGSKFAAVLVADLQAGATLTLTDIVII